MIKKILFIFSTMVAIVTTTAAGTIQPDYYCDPSIETQVPSNDWMRIYVYIDYQKAFVEWPKKVRMFTLQNHNSSLHYSHSDTGCGIDFHPMVGTQSTSSAVHSCPNGEIQKFTCHRKEFIPTQEEELIVAYQDLKDIFDKATLPAHREVIRGWRSVRCWGLNNWGKNVSYPGLLLGYPALPPNVHSGDLHMVIASSHWYDPHANDYDNLSESQLQVVQDYVDRLSSLAYADTHPPAWIEDGSYLVRNDPHNNNKKKPPYIVTLKVRSHPSTDSLVFERRVNERQPEMCQTFKKIK